MTCVVYLVCAVLPDSAAKVSLPPHTVRRRPDAAAGRGGVARQRHRRMRHPVSFVSMIQTGHCHPSRTTSSCCCRAWRHGRRLHIDCPSCKCLTETNCACTAGDCDVHVAEGEEFRIFKLLFDAAIRSYMIPEGYVVPLVSGDLAYVDLPQVAAPCCICQRISCTVMSVEIALPRCMLVLVL